MCYSIQSPVPSIVFAKGLPQPHSLFYCYLSLSPSIFVRPQDAIVCAAFAVASQKLKSKTVYGEAVYGFGYFMQISSITFQSIRQTVAEGSLDRIRGWWEGVTSFVRSTGSSSIFVHSTFNLFSQSPEPPNFPSPIELFTLLPPVTICNTHRRWRTTGLVQFSVLVMVTPSPVDWLSVGRSACPSVRPSVTHSIETRRGEWPVTSSSCACPKDFQSNLSNITTFNQTQKALQLIFLSSTLSDDDDDEDDETTLQDTHVTTNELTMDTATQSKLKAGAEGRSSFSFSTTEG